MTFKRFKQLWNKVAKTHSMTGPKLGKDVLVMKGCSKHTEDALIKAADGDFSEFDEINRKLVEWDARKDKLESKVANRA